MCIFLYNLYYTKTITNEVISSRWLFWVQTTPCYLQNWTFVQYLHSQLSDLKKSFTNKGYFFKTIILSTNNAILSSKLNILSHNSIPRCQIWKIPLQIWVIFFMTVILSTTNTMLSSKLNILSHYLHSKLSDQKNSFTNRGLFFSRWSFGVPTTLHYLQNQMFCPITPFQEVRIGKFIHNQGSFFPDDHFEYHHPMLSSKLNVLSHNPVPTRGCFLHMIILSTNNTMVSSKLNISSHTSVYLNIICSMST